MAAIISSIWSVGITRIPSIGSPTNVRVATEAPVDFVTGLTTAVLSAATFIVVLWTIGGSLTFTIGSAKITIPGFLVIAAVIYAVLASGSMVLIGCRFVTVSENKNRPKQSTVMCSPA